MDAKLAVSALGALAQDHRLQVFRMLGECGPEGLPAGVIAARLGIPPSSLTFHLHAILSLRKMLEQR